MFCSEPSHSFFVNSQQTCPLRKGGRLTYGCLNLSQKFSNDRLLYVKSNKWSTTCPGSSHSINNYSSSSRCSKCGEFHHTQLNFSKESSSTTTVSKNSSSASQSLSSVSNSPAMLLLSTAIIKVSASHGGYHQVRAIQGCYNLSNFITNFCWSMILFVDFGLSKKLLTPLHPQTTN